MCSNIKSKEYKENSMAELPLAFANPPGCERRGGGAPGQPAVPRSDDRRTATGTPPAAAPLALARLRAGGGIGAAAGGGGPRWARERRARERRARPPRRPLRSCPLPSAGTGVRGAPRRGSPTCCSRPARPGHGGQAPSGGPGPGPGWGRGAGMQGLLLQGQPSLKP